MAANLASVSTTASSTNATSSCSTKDASSISKDVSAKSSSKSSQLDARLATYADLDKIVAITKEVVAIIRADGNEQWTEKYPCRTHYETDVKNEDLYVVSETSSVVSEDNKILGFSALTSLHCPQYVQVGWDITKPAVVIYRLAVSPAARGKGVAGLLMAEGDKVAIARGHGLCRVDTVTENVATQKLILKCGYEYSGEMEVPGYPEGMRFLCYQKQNPV